MGLLKLIGRSVGQKKAEPTTPPPVNDEPSFDQEFPGWELEVSGNEINKYQGVLYHNGKIDSHVYSSTYGHIFPTVQLIKQTAISYIKKELKKEQTTIQTRIKL